MMGNETANGFWGIYLPEETLTVCKEIQKKTDENLGEVLSSAIQSYAASVGVDLH